MCMGVYMCVSAFTCYACVRTQLICMSVSVYVCVFYISIYFQSNIFLNGGKNHVCLCLCVCYGVVVYVNGCVRVSA